MLIPAVTAVDTSPPLFRLVLLCQVLFVLLLSGCATRPPVPDLEVEQYWQQHSEKLAALTIWELMGRFSVQLENDGWNAGLQWQQDGDRFNLRIVAPFGRGSVEISGDEGSVFLRTADDQIYENDDVDLLVQQSLGRGLPVSSLLFWIRGLPEPGVETAGMKVDPSGRLSELRQSGWIIRYHRYTRSQGYDVPQRMTLERDTLTVRLNIHKWQITR